MLFNGVSHLFHQTRSLMKFQLSILLFLVVVSLGRPSNAQVTFSPTAVFLESGSSVGTFYVSNPSDLRVEVNLSFEFAYPHSNSDGELSLNYDDESASKKYSLVPYIKAFPTQFLLQPNQRQTIRIAGRVPGSKEDGLHWSRMRISSKQLQNSSNDAETTAVSAQVNFQVDQVTAVFSRKGSISTGLNIKDMETSVAGDKLTVLTAVQRSGNSPYIGTSITKIFNSEDEAVIERKRSTSIYFEATHKSEILIDTLPGGEYYVVTEFQTNRVDIPSRHLPQSEPVSEVSHFTIK